MTQTHNRLQLFASTQLCFKEDNIKLSLHEETGPQRIVLT